MFDFLAANAGVLFALLAAILSAAVLTSRWESIALALQSAWHSVPLVGGVATLARRAAGRSGSDPQHAESSAYAALCGSYASFIRVLGRSDYDNYMNYLRKSGDLGRRPFPPFLWVVIFSMVIVEAAGLAYVLAGWTLPGASEAMQQVAAIGIGFLIAVILVFFTHWAGVELYQSNQYRRDRAEWIAAGRAGPLYGPDLSLNDAQSVDDREPGFRQRATRGHGKTTYFLTSVTLFMVLTIGGGAAYVRGQVLEQELVLEVASRARTFERFDLGSGDERAAAARTEVDRQALQQEVEIKRRGGWGTLAVLAIIFFFLQLLGMFFGYRYSFNGRLSRDAYRALKADQFSSYGELVRHYDRIADIAQSKLDRLAQRIERQRAGGISGALRQRPPSFRDYLHAREQQRRDQPLGGAVPEAASVSPGHDGAAAPAAAAGQAPGEDLGGTTGPGASDPRAALPAEVRGSARSGLAPRIGTASPAAPVAEVPAAPVTAPAIRPRPPGTVEAAPVGTACAASTGPGQAAAPAPAVDRPPGDEPDFRHRAVAALAAAQDARTMLEQAESIERQRAASRAARVRTRSAARPRPARAAEPEAG